MHTSKKEALEKIQSESADSAKVFSPDIIQTAPKVDIIQINYGPDSLKNFDFLSFLARSKAKLNSVIIDNLKTQENKYLNALKKEKSDKALMAEAIEAASTEINADIKLSKKLNTTTTLQLSGVNLTQVLDQISKRGNIDINSDLAELKIKGLYSGTISSILKTIAKENNLFIYKNIAGTGLLISTSQSSTLTLLDFDSFDTILETKKDLDVISKKYSEIFPKEGEKLNDEAHRTEITDELKTARAINFLEALISKIQKNTIEREQNKEISDIRKAIIQQSTTIDSDEETTGKNETEKVITTNSIYKPSIKEGEELIIEKFSVFNQTPDDLVKTITSYSVFKTGNCAVIEAKAASVEPTISTTPTTTPTTTKTTTTVAATESTTCVKLTLDKDATGIIASGSINDIKLVEKLINDQDNPVKQVLLEVYILEVNSGWASSLESTISRTTQTPNTAAATTIVRGGLLGATALSGGINVSTAFGAKNDITALINLLETNSLGKTISKPSIIVKDAATGTVKKDRTFRQAITSIIQNVAPTPPTIATSYIDIISPLTLTVTPKINKHNDNIDLAFSFTQTKRDNDVSPTSPTSTNNITTNLLIEPGKVIVLAGLKVESEATSSEGMPFLAKLGLEPIFGPLVGLLGGTQALSKSSTELLVIINPTVITSKNIAKTMDKALK